MSFSFFFFSGSGNATIPHGTEQVDKCCSGFGLPQKDVDLFFSKVIRGCGLKEERDSALYKWAEMELNRLLRPCNQLYMVSGEADMITILPSNASIHQAKGGALRVDAWRENITYMTREHEHEYVCTHL